MAIGATEIDYLRWDSAGLTPVTKPTPREVPLTLQVEGDELLTMMCTPQKLKALVVGFLYLNDIIATPAELDYFRVCADDQCAEIRLDPPRPVKLQRLALGSGCSATPSSMIDERKVSPLTDFAVTSRPALIQAAMLDLYQRALTYRASGGIHAAAAFDERGELVVVAEDIGRHNTIDKVIGECLLRDIAMDRLTVLATGRISSEMLLKCAKLRVPIVGSRTSPTALSIDLARRLGVTVVGYIRSVGLNIYSHPERLGLPADALPTANPALTVSADSALAAGDDD